MGDKKDRRRVVIDPEAEAQREFALRKLAEEEAEKATPNVLPTPELVPEPDLEPATTRKQSGAEFKKKVLAGIAIMRDDLNLAISVLKAKNVNIDALPTHHTEHYVVFGAVEESQLDLLGEMEAVLEAWKPAPTPGKANVNEVRYSSAVSVPVAHLQTAPIFVENKGAVVALFCSSNGLPFQSKFKDGRRTFTRPTFWLIELEFGSDDFHFVASLYGQYAVRDDEGNRSLEYRPMHQQSDDTKPIVTRQAEDENELIEATGISDKFLSAIIGQCEHELRRVRHERERKLKTQTNAHAGKFHNSVERPLGATIGERMMR